MEGRHPGLDVVGSGACRLDHMANVIDSVSVRHICRFHGHLGEMVTVVPAGNRHANAESRDHVVKFAILKYTGLHHEGPAVRHDCSRANGIGDERHGLLRLYWLCCSVVWKFRGLSKVSGVHNIKVNYLRISRPRIGLPCSVCIA